MLLTGWFSFSCIPHVQYSTYLPTNSTPTIRGRLKSIHIFNRLDTLLSGFNHSYLVWDGMEEEEEEEEEEED